MCYCQVSKSDIPLTGSETSYSPFQKTSTPLWNDESINVSYESVVCDSQLDAE